MLAGIQDKSTQLIDFSGNHQLHYSEGFLAGFQQHYPIIENAYKFYLAKQGSVKTAAPIPLVLLFPLHTSNEEKKALSDLIKSSDQYGPLLYVGSIEHHYLKSLQEEQLLRPGNSMILNALGPTVSSNVIFSNIHKPALTENIDQLGWQSGKAHILEFLITQLAQEGFMSGAEEVQKLEQQIVATDVAAPFFLEKKSQQTNVSIQLNINQSDWNNLLASDHTLLQQKINNTLITQHNISNLILMGKYFENDIILNYICNDLQMRGLIIAPDISQETTVFSKIINSAFDQANTIRNTLSEIQEKVKHHSSSNSVSLNLNSNTQLIIQPKELDLQNSSARSSKLNEQSIELIAKTPPLIDPINRPSSSSFATIDLEHYFQLDDIYSTKEYLFFKGEKQEFKETKVIRFVDHQSTEHSNKLKGFQRLHQMESSYYPDVSSIQTIPIGQFYTRNFIEGMGLHNYMKNYKIHKRRNINQLNNSNLNLILQIWKEINGLNFACKNLQEGNILVQSKLKWNLTRQVTIKLVGFNAAVCPKSEMVEDFHQIFSRQFGQQLYSQIRNKFKL